jgi:O-antigen/teichoic acid export membrane protein
MKSVKQFIKSKTFKTTFNLMVNMVATGIVGLIFWRIASSVFPETSQIGVAGTLIAVTNISSIIAAAGLNPAVLLMFSNKGDGRFFANHIIGFKTVSSIVSGFISAVLMSVLMFVPNFAFLQNPTVFILVVLLSGSMASGLVLDYSMVATGQSRFVPYRNVFVSLVKTIVLGLVVWFVSSAGEGVVLATLVAKIVGNSIYTFKGTGKNFTGFTETVAVLKLLKENLFSHQVSSLAASLPSVIAPLIIVGMLSTSDAGLFTISWLLAGLLFYAATAVSSAFLSDAANFHYRVIKVKIKKAMFFGGLLMVSGVAGFIVFGEFFLNFFGTAYSEAYVLMVLLAAASVPDFFKNILVAYSRSRGFLKIPTVVNSVSAIMLIFGLVGFLTFFDLTIVGVLWLLVSTMSALIAWGMVKFFEKEQQ